MKTIHAVWKDGRIVPTQPVDWPDGTELSVGPIGEFDAAGPDAEILGDNPESIACWVRWFDSLEPLDFTPAEDAAWQAARRENRAWEKAHFDERAEALKDLFE